MWDFKSAIDPLAERAIRNVLTLAGIQLGDDEKYGVYTVTEAAGYIPPVTGADFFSTFNISLSVFCFLPWLPPKSDAEAEFITIRRGELFDGASSDYRRRILIAARVNRQAFDALKNGNRSLRPFDLFNFI